MISLYKGGLLLRPEWALPCIHENNALKVGPATSTWVPVPAITATFTFTGGSHDYYYCSKPSLA